MQPVEVCPNCGKPWEDGGLCPPCEEEDAAIRREIDACPDCGGVSDSPGASCPPCAEAWAEARAEADAEEEW